MPISQRFLHKAVVLTLAVGTLLPLSSSYASAVINLNTYTGANYGADSLDASNTSVEATADATNSPRSSQNMGTGLTGSSTGVDATAADSLMMSLDTFSEGQSVSVTRAQIESRESGVNDGSQATVMPKTVVTNGDLQAYAEGALRSDSYLEELSFTNDTVEVRYKEEGRLLALVPITFSVKVVAHADGSVDVKYPWYSVMTVDKKSELEAKIKVAVDNALRAHNVGSVRAQGEAQHEFSAPEAAEVAAQIQAVLKAGSETAEGSSY